MEKIHFIAIGGAAMHNLAIALSKKGLAISGSDDEIFNPSLSRLKEYGLLPDSWGWNPEKIDNSIDAIILGMHARRDNPELLRAQELGLHIFSYPEFLYHQTYNKTRVVIAGSHGKTSITAMILHVLKSAGRNFDYMVGSQIEGFDTMVGLSEENEIAIFEGDEYLSSPIDLRPKFMHYKPDIALISGIAWDHINVFPTYEGYVNQFRLLLNEISESGSLVYYEGDKEINGIVTADSSGIKKVPYNEHASITREGKNYLITSDGEEVPILIFGKHNLQNLRGAQEVCYLLGVKPAEFYKGISTFGGTARRLQKLYDTSETKIFLDFAHSPSKVKATVEAVKEQFPEKELVAIFELHTFSSLNKNFLPQYKNCLDKADTPLVFFNKEVVLHKKLDFFTEDYVADCFGDKDIFVISDKSVLEDYIRALSLKNKILLFMSSGNFAGINMQETLQLSLL